MWRMPLEQRGSKLTEPPDGVHFLRAVLAGAIKVPEVVFFPIAVGLFRFLITRAPIREAVLDPGGGDGGGMPSAEVSGGG